MPLEVDYDDAVNKSNDLVNDSKWTKLFPACVADPDQSANFMMRALYVGFSVILNRRGILPADHFTKNHITEKICCKTLNFKNPNALRISQLLRNAALAVRQGFLREIALVITENEGDHEAIEVFSFTFHYENGLIKGYLNKTKETNQSSPLERLAYLEYKGTSSVRDQLIMLTRSIVYLCEKILEPLPKEFDANFRLDYTSSAPNGYRVDGFSDSSTLYTLPENIQSATIGHLRPGHHACLVDCTSIHIVDSYHAELNLKRFIEKVADKLGFDSNDVLYKSFSSDGNFSQTSSEAVRGDDTIDRTTKVFADFATPTSSAARPMTRRGSGTSNERVSPYKQRPHKR